MEDEGCVDTVRGKLASEEIPQYARVGEPVQAVPDCKHVEERTKHREDHDGEEVLEKVLLKGFSLFCSLDRFKFVNGLPKLILSSINPMINETILARHHIFTKENHGNK